MGQHRAAHHVADGVNTRHVGSEVIVDDNATAIHRNAGCFKTEIVRVRTTARCDQHNIAFERNSRTACNRLECDRAALALLLNLGDFGREIEGKALLFQNALELFGDFAIHARQDTIEIFDDHNFRAKTAPDRTEFETDHARADDDQFGRNLVERQSAGRRHNDLLVELHIDARRRCNVGASGNHNILRLERCDLAIIRRHIDFAGTLD
jgi:hypothetical protein